jgi:hypothetical protein
LKITITVLAIFRHKMGREKYLYKIDFHN